MSVLVLFGPTGAGKTFIGQLLKKEFGYFFYDGDVDLTEEMKQALRSNRIITDRMRQKFITRMINSIIYLAAKHKNLVVAQTFIKNKYRQRLLIKLPHTHFILINTKETLRHRRRRHRADWPWDEIYVKKMDALFEPPQIPHLTITNDSNGPKNLISSLRSLLSNLS